MSDLVAQFLTPSPAQRHRTLLAREKARLGYLRGRASALRSQLRRIERESLEQEARVAALRDKFTASGEI